MRQRNSPAASSIAWQRAPGERPLRLHSDPDIETLWRAALAEGDGLAGAHCIHELWMRGAMPAPIETALGALWQCSSASIPEWLPMRYIDWLPQAYDIAARYRADSGRSNLYLVLLDYRDRGGDPYGVYVGMSRYAPAQRFDQHKSGIRAAGSVLKRGLEVLTGPTLHLQHIRRAEAERIEGELAQALAQAGLTVEGGH